MTIIGVSKAGPVEAIRVTVAELLPWALTVKAIIDDVLVVFDADLDRIVEEYMQGGRIDRAREALGRAIVAAYTDAAYAGWSDAGGDPAALEQVDIGKEHLEQINRARSLFFDLEELRERMRAGEDVGDIIANRLELWKSNLRGWYNEWKLRQTGDRRSVMLTWVLGPTEHCNTCDRLAGQSHTAGWYLRRNYIPGRNGAAMDCGGWRCGCHLEDDDGNPYTL